MKKTEIMLDVDFKIEPEQMARRVRFVEHIAGVSLKLRDVKETAHGYHFYYDVPVFPSYSEHVQYTRVILQLLLGSDYKREAFNWRRVRDGIENWNVLFKAKFRKENGRLVQVSGERPAVLWGIFYALAYEGQGIKKEIAEWKERMSAVIVARP